MKKELLLLASWLVVICFSASNSFAFEDLTELKSRAFELAYRTTIRDVPIGATVRVWFPIAESNAQQKVEISSFTSRGIPMQQNRDTTYNNLIGFFETKQKLDDDVQFGFLYDVVRYEANVDDSAKKLTADQKKRFLSANTLVPIEGKPQELIQNISLPTEAMDVGQALYNVVDQHMKYDKSNPGYGQGNVVWACNSKTGNCTDFHSLFISLARSCSVPARFEIGFPIANDRKRGVINGYHCWAWFHVDGKGWVPVDISEADKHPEMKDYYFGKLTTDRISFSTGRDIVLVPKSEARPKNYFIYPHVEVDGKTWPKEKIKLAFSFTDK